MLDMEERLRPARKRTFALLALALIATGPWLGWWPVLFLIPAGLLFAGADRLLPRVSRPEHLLFATWVGSSLVIAGAVALDGGPRVATLSWLVLPVITLSARFSMRGVIAGVVINSALVIGVAYAIDPHAVITDPSLVIAPLALMVGVASLSTPLMTSDIEHRSDAVIDQLTGMLNRKALGTRAAELAQQSRLTGQPVGILIGDLDHFKEVNDNHGHALGDAVLKEVAYELRKQLRAFDLAYRLGGEEFLVLLPGADVEQAAFLAERLREAVAGCDLGGRIQVTMSFGVAASKANQGFSYTSVFAQADSALYEAKRTGRNRVCAAREPRLVRSDGRARLALAAPGLGSTSA